MKQVFAVLSRQADWRGAFGKTAREMRLLTKRQLADLLLLQTESTPSLSELLIEMRLVTPEIVAHELARARDSKLDHCLPLSKDSQGIDSSLPAFVTNVQSEAFAHANQTSE